MRKPEIHLFIYSIEYTSPQVTEGNQRVPGGSVGLRRLLGESGAHQVVNMNSREVPKALRGVPGVT